MFADSHTHSCFSFDGAEVATVDEMCRHAISLGLTDLAITDHCDVSGEADGFYAKYDRYRAQCAVLEAKEHYRGKLRIAYGIELGEATQNPEYAMKLLSECRFDFVLGSLHNLKGVPDFFYLDFSHPDFPPALLTSLFSRYLEELLEMCDFPGIHSLSHLTYPLRYYAKGGKSIQLSDFEEPIRQLFSHIISRGIALEVNTSTLAGPLSRELLKLYRECGGSLVTVGSDAHSPERIGFGIQTAYQMLRELGFTRVAVFYNGQPEMYSIG